MATTTFVDGQTVILADWLNDVNTIAYNPVGLQSKGHVDYSVDTTLTTADFGKTLQMSGTCTLTAPTAIGNTGKILTGYNYGTGIVTIASYGGEVIYAQGRVAVTSITLHPGEGFSLVSNGSGWIQVGGAIRLRSGTTVASTSGTSIDFTGIPAGTKRITVMLSTVSTTGATRIRFQLGDSGGIETTGYTSSSSYMDSAVSSIYPTNGFEINITSGSPSGSIVFTRLDSTSSRWTASGVFSYSGTNTIAGTKTLSAELTQIRITTVAGTETFSAGSINILYE